jgi:hypothetical protein
VKINRFLHDQTLPSSARFFLIVWSFAQACDFVFGSVTLSLFGQVRETQPQNGRYPGDVL